MRAATVRVKLDDGSTEDIPAIIDDEKNRAAFFVFPESPALAIRKIEDGSRDPEGFLWDPAENWVEV